MKIVFNIPWRQFRAGQVVDTEFTGWATELLRRGLARLDAPPVSAAPEAMRDEGAATLTRQERRRGKFHA